MTIPTSTSSPTFSEAPDPEVLIIDEVLAVGDLSFQDRAFGRITEMVQSGIPVVLVSHQLDRVATLCTKAILLEKGQVRMTGNPEERIAEYVLKPSDTVTDSGRHDCPVHVRRLHIESAVPARSGSELRFQLSGDADSGAQGRFDPYNVRVRSAQTGKLVFAVQGTALGLPCPDAGPFEAEIQLQLNVPAGIYALETFVRDTSGSREVGQGPVAYVQLSEGTRFQGTVQMNPSTPPGACIAAGLMIASAPPTSARYEALDRQTITARALWHDCRAITPL